MEFLQTRPNLKIRRMMLEDLDAVMEIEPKAFGSHHWTRNNFTLEMNNPRATYLVAEDSSNGSGAKIIAYGGSWIVLDEMHITTLATDPDARRKHAAEAIIAAFIDQGSKSGVRGITLEVRESNIAAQKLYEKYRFQRQGLRKNYYHDNHEDAVLLWTEDIQSEQFKALFEKNLTKLAL